MEQEHMKEIAVVVVRQWETVAEQHWGTGVALRWETGMEVLAMTEHMVTAGQEQLRLCFAEVSNEEME